MATLKITKITGLRPDELNNIPLHLNQNPIKTRALYIPTLKTRILPSPIREFPLSLEDAVDVSVYINARAAFLAYLNIDPIQETSFMLSHNGASMETRSLARDFRRLCKLSGLINVQVCLSMFRHRFITTQIAYEIRRELQDNLAQKDLWLEAVQRRILAKVAKLTGHRNPMSLKHYFDEGFALVIAQATENKPTQTKQLIAKLEEQIVEISQNSAVHSDPHLVKAVSELEKILIQLKNR
jgi:hypothetical protein